MAGARALRKRSMSSPRDEKYQAQAAGSWALKIELGGAVTLSVWKVPPSTGRVGLMSSLNARRAAEMVWVKPQLTEPRVCRADPSRSRDMVSPAMVIFSLTG